MRERIRCRDFGDGERIFVTDWDKILNTLMIILIGISLLNIFFGLYINYDFLVVAGVLGLLVVLVAGYYLSSQDRRWR